MKGRFLPLMRLPPRYNPEGSLLAGGGVVGLGEGVGFKLAGFLLGDLALKYAGSLRTIASHDSPMAGDHGDQFLQ